MKLFLTVKNEANIKECSANCVVEGCWYLIGKTKENRKLAKTFNTGEGIAFLPVERPSPIYLEALKCTGAKYWLVTDLTIELR